MTMKNRKSELAGQKLKTEPDIIDRPEETVEIIDT